MHPTTHSWNYLHASSYSHMPAVQAAQTNPIQQLVADDEMCQTRFALLSQQQTRRRHAWPGRAPPSTQKPTAAGAAGGSGVLVCACLTSKRDHSMPFRRRRRGDHAPWCLATHKGPHPAPQGRACPLHPPPPARTSSRTCGAQPMQ